MVQVQPGMPAQMLDPRGCRVIPVIAAALTGVAGRTEVDGVLVCGNRWRLGLTACWGRCMVAWRRYAPWNVLQLHTATIQAVMKGVRACPPLGMGLMN